MGTSSTCRRRNPDAFAKSAENATTPAYTLSQSVPADAALSAALLQALQSVVGPGDLVAQGLNASADSFYSSQVWECPTHHGFVAS